MPNSGREYKEVIKNCKRFSMLFFLQAKKKSELAGFLETGGRPEAPGSERKGNLLLIAITVARVSTF